MERERVDVRALLEDAASYEGREVITAGYVCDATHELVLLGPIDGSGGKLRCHVRDVEADRLHASEMTIGRLAAVFGRVVAGELRRCAVGGGGLKS